MGQTTSSPASPNQAGATPSRTLGISDIPAMQEAVAKIPEDDPDLPYCLTVLAAMLSKRYHVSGYLPDVDEAIRVGRRAVALTQEGDPKLSSRLNNLANALVTRSEQSGPGASADVEEAIQLGQRAVVLCPEDREELPDILNNLAGTYLRRVALTGKRQDIEKAISIQERAVELVPEGRLANHRRLLLGLGISYQKLSASTGDLTHINKSISLLGKSLEMSPEGQEDLPTLLQNLGISLRLRYKLTRDPADIEASISKGINAVESTPEGHVRLPGRIGSLKDSLFDSFRHNNHFPNLAEAITLQQKLVKLTQEGDSNLLERLSDLANLLKISFGYTGELSDIQEAIDLERRVVALTPADQADITLPGLLDSLGGLLVRRYGHTGDSRDIEEAISLRQRAVRLQTQRGHADLCGFLHNLGVTFLERFRRTRMSSDVEEAVSLHKRALETSPEGHPDLPIFHGSLGDALLASFEDASEPHLDFEGAISAHRKAVELTPQGHLDLPRRLRCLGNALISRYERDGNPGDVEEAISVQKTALSLVPEGHENAPAILTDLGDSLLRRFQRTSDPKDIEEAMTKQCQALELTPQGHPNRVAWLSNLGVVHYQKFNSSFGTAGDLVASIACWKAAATSITAGPSSDKLVAAKWWALRLHVHYDYLMTEPASDARSTASQLLQAFECVVNLLASVAGLGRTLQERHSILVGESGVALDAASAALTLGRVDKALEWLEQGRCLVWNQLNSLRSPFEELQAHDSDLAQRLEETSRQLEYVSSSRKPSHRDGLFQERDIGRDETRVHLELVGRREALLAKVRAIPGFEAFLQPSPASSLTQHLPPEGYVVVVNVSLKRCDAIILSKAKGFSGELQHLHVPLPGLTATKVVGYRQDLRAELEAHQLVMREAAGEESTMSEHDTGQGADEERGVRLRLDPRKARATIVDILRGLWIELVKPVLDALGLMKHDSSSNLPLPRIWWCPTGPLSFLPIHAAGLYGGSDSESILDYAISSYTPTISALTERVKASTHLDRSTTGGLFLTSQPNAPGAPPIPGTTAEVQAIHAKAKSNQIRCLKLEGDELSLEACLEHMAAFSSVHLACHASQRADDPLASRFLFHTGSLDLHTIINQRRSDAAAAAAVADLAFLSACQTSAGVDRLSDEAVHLAAGMLAAGYRRVVATMWSIKDRHAVEVATDFYDYLWSQRKEGAAAGGFDGSRSAEALHYAIQRLKAKLNGDSERALLAWIPYVHFGY